MILLKCFIFLRGCSQLTLFLKNMCRLFLTSSSSIQKRKGIWTSLESEGGFFELKERIIISSTIERNSKYCNLGHIWGRDSRKEIREGRLGIMRHPNSRRLLKFEYFLAHKYGGMPIGFCKALKRWEGRLSNWRRDKLINRQTSLSLMFFSSKR